MFGFTTSTSPSDGHRVHQSRLDRLWTDGTPMIAVGPIDLPTRSELVDALVAIALAGPDARVGLGFDRTGRHWRFDAARLTEHCDRAVIEMDPGRAEDMDALLSSIGPTITTERPLAIVRAGQYLVVAVRHSLGDARFIVGLPETLLEHCRTGRLANWVTAPVDRHPLRSALVQTFVADRTRAPKLIRHLRPERPGPRPEHRRSPGIGPVLPFRPDPLVVSAVTGPGGTEAIAGWGKQHAPGASTASLIVSLAHQALKEVGITCGPGLLQVFDARRFLPDGHTTNGNFVVGLNLPVDLADPESITSATRSAGACGRPVAALAVSVAKHMVPTRRSRPVELPVDAPAELALSFIGQHPGIDRLPWLGPVEQRIYACRADPAGPAAITLLPSILGDSINLAACFHSTVFDPSVVRAAMTAAAGDPVAILDRLGHA